MLALSVLALLSQATVMAAEHDELQRALQAYVHRHSASPDARTTGEAKSNNRSKPVIATKKKARFLVDRPSSKRDTPIDPATLPVSHADQKFKYLAVLDFEATCSDTNDSAAPQIPSDEVEIIEIPVVVINTVDGAVHATFHTYVKPKIHPDLTDFCVSFTGIQQEWVDRAPSFKQAHAMLAAWLAEHGLDETNTVFATCGDWDLKTMWPQQLTATGLPTFRVLDAWINVKHVWWKALKYDPKGGMVRMLQDLGIAHVGHHHSGIDDVRNICKILQWFIEHNYYFDYTYITANWSD